MNCIIIEDQTPAQRILKKYISDIGTLELKGTFSDAIQAVAFLKEETVDLIFLDIHLPKISGIDLLKIINNPPLVILTTAFPNYALESYDFDVVDYLLKPFSFQRFIKAVTKASERLSSKEEQKKETKKGQKELFIKSGHEHIKIIIDHILYLQADSDYVEVYVNEKKYLSSKSLKYWEELLSNQQFVRIHKSYIINLKKIEKITGSRVFLEQGKSLPIGRAYKATVVRYLERHQ